MIGVINILENDVSVAGVVSDRVFPIERQQGTNLPAITVDVTDVEPNGTKDGVSTLDEEFTRVTNYAQTLVECLLLAGFSRAALDRYTGTNQGVVIQQIDFLSEIPNKAQINNKRVYTIEQQYKVRVIR